MTLKEFNDWFKVSWAQNREDLILRACFPSQAKGFYIDIGAHDPDYFSVSKLFYQMGWKGIHVEPQPALNAKLKLSRQGDIVLPYAAGRALDQLKLREFKDATGLSTLSEQMKSEYQNGTGKYSKVTKQYKDEEVKVVTLKWICDKYCKNKQIDFIKIDVEGFEADVIAGGDWVNYRPKVICIEANHKSNNWSEDLAKLKYKQFFNDGLNEYYVASEYSKTLQKEFNYSESVLAKISVQGEVARLVQEQLKIDDRNIIKRDRQIKTLIKQRDDLYNQMIAVAHQRDQYLKAFNQLSSKPLVKLNNKLEKMIGSKKGE